MATTKSKRTVVGVSFNADELKELDRQRARLRNCSRATALKQMWQWFDDEAVDGVHSTEAAAAARENDIAPLVEAIDRAAAAWHERADQRQMIGVNLNQITRLANILRIRLRDGEVAAEDMHDELDRLLTAQQAIRRSLDEQAAVEAADDRVLDEARSLIIQMRIDS